MAEWKPMRKYRRNSTAPFDVCEGYYFTILAERCGTPLPVAEQDYNTTIERCWRLGNTAEYQWEPIEVTYLTPRDVNRMNWQMAERGSFIRRALGHRRADYSRRYWPTLSEVRRAGGPPDERTP